MNTILSKLIALIKNLPRDILYIKESLGRIEARQVRLSQSSEDLEFRVFSQWGEDGILQYLISRVPLSAHKFVEFGVEDYSEANTRFLLSTFPWQGLVIDGCSNNIDKIRKSTLFATTQLVALHSFITAENINSLIASYTSSDDIDLLSIDIDGNDFWVWKSLDIVKPRIVVVEYNSLFGPDLPITIPYKSDFVRRNAHYSQLYYGASLESLVQLGDLKGYALVYGNNAGNNAFFVRKDLCTGLQVRAAHECYRRSQFRESLDKKGKRSFLSFERARDLIAEMPVCNTKSGLTASFGSYT